jgi:HTH-type transcriptional regulator, transcriptional repressor of NAD biosynthesis genes
VELDARVSELLLPEIVIRGLVIGKFMPIHNGHLALIRFAASQCDELIVSLSFTPADPILGSMRFSWLQQIFKDDLKIKPALVEDNFDDESLPLTHRTKVWADFIRKTYPPIDVVFGSEQYGESFASNLGARHRLFDLHRVEVPVSATLIRQHPLRYWEFLPKVVQPFFVKKICFYGPESTGKSSMTLRMAEKYNTTLVPEVAREMLITNNFSEADIIRIGEAHHERIQQKIKEANKFLMCDTDAITTQLYAHYYLGVVPEVLFALEKQTHHDHYFLFDIDVPWIDDGLRDLGHLRKEMFTLFKNALHERNIPYTRVYGSWDEREQIVIRVLDSFL